MVVHKNKMLSRLKKIQETEKQCYSLNNLVASSTVFNNYMSGFGNRACGRDMAILIASYANAENDNYKSTNSETIKNIVKQLKKHKYYLHAALIVVDTNIQFLKKKFDNSVIFRHCQLLLYPLSELEYYLNHLLELRSGNTEKTDHKVQLDATYNNLKYHQLTDDQILSLVLYEIEKKYHFSGDGIWAKQDKVNKKMSAT